MSNKYNLKGLSGSVENVHTAATAANKISILSKSHIPKDIDIKNMAAWALHYLIHTPRKQYDYEPVFQCHPLRCPPVPDGQDVVAACDTDARMEWEWYFMRDITGSKDGLEVESAFHKRMRKYIDENGVVWSHPGCYNEGDINAEYDKEDIVVHNWGAAKILKSLSEDYRRTGSSESLVLAQKVMKALKKLATWDDMGRCWFIAGMGALRADGSIVPNPWNKQPLPIVEPLVTYWLATGDEEGLKFAKASAKGLIYNLQPGSIEFHSDGSIGAGFEQFDYAPHSHATMHAVWGIADLGIITGEEEYIDFAKRAFDWMLTRGTGTGWFPSGPDSCNETCCLSDMISIACALGKWGYSEYFDYAERYFRNHINNQQFILTEDFKQYYRSLHKDKNVDMVEKGLTELEKFQGGIVGGTGLNDYENVLLGGRGGYEMYGCCAPEGMRAIHTIWSHAIEKLPASVTGDEGIYVNMCFNRKSQWGDVVSFMNEEGRVTVKAAIDGDFFIRVPSWVSHSDAYAFVNAKPCDTVWRGDYVKLSAKIGDELTVTWPLVGFTHKVSGLWKSCAPELEMTYEWLGNMVVKVQPAAEHTALFLGKPRIQPDYASID